MKASCANLSYCNGKGGVYDETLDNCFCDGLNNAPEFYCDANCQFKSLKVYYTRDGFIEMEANGVNRVFAIDEFDDKFFFAGLDCPISRCSIMSQAPSRSSTVSLWR